MADPATLLVADDDPGLRESLERTLTREGYRVLLASDGRAALERVQTGGIDLIVTDLKMPGLTGLELLRPAKPIAPDVDVILLTAFGTVEEAVKAMKDGAYDFLTKPFRREQLIKLVDKALERRDLIEQNQALKKQLEDIRAKGQMIGASPAFRRMLTLVEQVADSSATLLIPRGSGTGKEGAARLIHGRSGRKDKPFVAVNCAALPETLLESELFGYEKGAFTGAAGRKEGRFELANGGTLFLDEVADLSLVTQPKILRVLQAGEFERLGATRTIQVDVRIVAATNRDLSEMVKDKRFREDLYYRLNVITVRVPPLREHPEDIRLLAQHYLRVYSAKNGRKLEAFSNEAIARLESYAWPGNVRELENLVERSVLLARKDRIGADELPGEGHGGSAARPSRPSRSACAMRRSASPAATRRRRPISWASTCAPSRGSSNVARTIRRTIRRRAPTGREGSPVDPRVSAAHLWRGRGRRRAARAGAQPAHGRGGALLRRALRGGGGRRGLASGLHPLGARGRGEGRPALRAHARDALDRAGDGPRPGRCRRRPRAHLVRGHGRALDPYAPPDSALRDAKQHGAAPALESRSGGAGLAH